MREGCSLGFLTYLFCPLDSGTWCMPFPPVWVMIPRFLGELRQEVWFMITVTLVGDPFLLCPHMVLLNIDRKPYLDPSLIVWIWNHLTEVQTGPVQSRKASTAFTSMTLSNRRFCIWAVATGPFPWQCPSQHYSSIGLFAVIQIFRIFLIVQQTSISNFCMSPAYWGPCFIFSPFNVWIPSGFYSGFFFQLGSLFSLETSKYNINRFYPPLPFFEPVIRLKDKKDWRLRGRSPGCNFSWKQIYLHASAHIPP